MGMRTEMKHLFGAALAAFLLSAGLSHAAEIEDLNTTDSSNTARFFEGMPPGSVDNGMRAVEGILARWHEDTGCRKATTGSADAYSFAAAQTLSSLYDGLIVCVEIHATNTGVSTLNIDSIGTKSIKKHGDEPLAAGDLTATFKYLVVYDGTQFQLLSQLGVAPAVTGEDNNFSVDQTFVSTNAGATEGPGINLDRLSASPAAADVMGAIRLKGRDAAGNLTTYSKISAEIVDPAEGSEDGRLVIATMIAGAAGDRFIIGAGLFADGNTDPGAGKIDADGLLISGLQVEATKLDTPQAATSTPLDFTAPFATVTRAIVIFEAVSLNSTNDVTVQIGPTAGIETTGYVSTSNFLAGGGGPGGDEVLNASSSAGFIIQNDNAGHFLSGTMDLALSNSSNNTWVSSHSAKQGGTASVNGGGNKDLAGALTTVRVAGTTFDAGEINVRWYGF